jgi:hypothetical protein
MRVRRWQSDECLAASFKQVTESEHFAMKLNRPQALSKQHEKDHRQLRF